ncbi:MAG: oligosaccharide flippase family protein [Alicyclobacillus sp.]|nr:oligosaccharide flippase family protein [Alicyclobacillus sp.]
MRMNQGFVRGAMMLAGAAVLSKLLGSVYTIVLQNIIGDNGMGLFQMAYPIYATLLAIATAGFPVAISKLVSERLALGDEGGVRKVFRVAAWLLCAAGVVTFVVLFFGAPFWAQVAGDRGATWAIRAIAPALLLVPVMSAVRGYFQGYQWMDPTATSQVLEQFVRVATILGLSLWLTTRGYSHEITAAGAAFGAVTGAFAGLLLLLWYWVRHHARRTVPPRAPGATSSWGLVRQLIYYAFPISLGALVVPLMNNIDVVTVVNLLKHVGESQNLATTQFGLLSGRAAKLMMLPTTLAAGVGIAVMPAVSEAYTLGQRERVSDRIDMAIRLTMMMALPATVGLALLAAPVDVALFKDTAGVETIQVMACATVFASVQTAAAGVLQGSGRVYLPVVYLLVACAAKLVGNLVLVPTYGIAGAAAATVASYALAAALNLRAIARYIGIQFEWGRWLLKPALATFVMGAFVFAAQRQWVRVLPWDNNRLIAAVGCCACVALGIIVYGLALLATGTLTEPELRQIPKVGDAVCDLCLRVGLLRPRT